MNIIGFNKNVSNQDNPWNQGNPWQTNYCKNSTIFGKHTFVPFDTERQNNDNTLIIGTSGTGKTYSFVEPNVLQGNANYVIADAKGDILRNTGESLKKMGYKIQVLNLVDLAHSMTYNPLHYMKDQLSVFQFAHTVVKSDISGNVIQNMHEDPFWDNAAEDLLLSLIFFTKEFLPKSEQTIATVNRLFNLVNQSPDQINEVLSTLTNGSELDHFSMTDYDPNNDTRTLGDYLFAWVAEQNPTSTALDMWRKVSTSKTSEKMWSSIVGILGSDLARYSLSDVENLMNNNQINFDALLEPKTALFILYDDADTSKNFISNTLYTQLFSYLYHAARLTNNRLPVKVRFFLDDFKNIQIPDFDDYLATARSRNISICMMLQDESQLKAKFGINTPSVIGNCASYLLTGTTDLAMANTASVRFSLAAEDIRIMDPNTFLVDIAGHRTSTERYDYQEHPNYISQKLDINSTYNTPILDHSSVVQNWPKLVDILKQLPNEARERHSRWGL